MITPELERAIKLHARAKYPEEMCGIIHTGEFIAADNKHPNPLDHFRMDPEYLENAEAIVHSHTFADANSVVDMRTPSQDDIRSQLDTDVPWYIVGVTKVGVSPPLNITPNLNESLWGRSFVHCVTDCWQLARSYYWQKHGIEMMDVVRGYTWWDEQNPVSLIDTHYKEFGFERVTEPREGDAIILKVLSKVNNHVGIFTADGKILHHMVNRLSGEEQFEGKWKKYATMYLRHKDIK